MGKQQLVKVAVKTPMLDMPLVQEVEGDLTLEAAVDRCLASPVADPNGRRLQTQISRERSGEHSYIAFEADGRARSVPPKTRIIEIAIPRELVNPASGRREEVSLAALEIQSYAKVGRAPHAIGDGR